MLSQVRRRASIYAAIAAMVPKLFLAYSIWVWVELFTQILTMAIMTSFWRAVFAGAGSATIGGLTLQQTLNYILVAQILAPLVESRFLFTIGSLLRDGGIGIELVRPVDMQTRYMAENLAELATDMVFKAPLLLVAWLLFGLELPTDPARWAAFLAALLLGRVVFFYFNWLFASLAFYTTEVWGLAVLYEGIGRFFSGALLPLTILPGWLRLIAAALPFAQVLYAPVALLTGITPLAEAPRVFLTQLAWLVGLAVVSRLAFGRALRTVTVQGG
ncbi:MAG TPA: ABC-2 family transporter protein [Chloroflexaceae bacterium]|nr:ABC-2 family transporter protein [Chloroflexaceae bacterium]